MNFCYDVSMHIDTLIQGMIIGFSIAAPIGPIGILCIKRTLQHGRKSGLATGLGAACAGMFYGSIAAFGLSSISDQLISLHSWISRIGGLFLLYLGAKIFFSNTSHQESVLEKQSLKTDFITTFFLTIVNPMTIVSFLTVFAALGLGQNEGISPSLMIWGVFLGAMVWWLILTNSVALFRKKINQKILKWINRIAGLIILGFGFYFFFFL